MNDSLFPVYKTPGNPFFRAKVRDLMPTGYSQQKIWFSTIYVGKRQCSIFPGALDLLSVSEMRPPGEDWKRLNSWWLTAWKVFGSMYQQFKPGMWCLHCWSLEAVWEFTISFIHAPYCFRIFSSALLFWNHFGRGAAGKAAADDPELITWQRGLRVNVPHHWLSTCIMESLVLLLLRAH